MNPTQVVVVGAGPTGLMLACELALADVQCRILERRDGQSNVTRAFAVHARTLELLDARGFADELVPREATKHEPQLAEVREEERGIRRGVPVRQLAPAPGAVLDLTEFDTPYPMVLMAPQSATEYLLEARAKRLGVQIDYGAEIVGLTQDGTGVDVQIRTRGVLESERVSYLVGCDGSHSAVRALIGVDFVGKQYQTHILLADVQLTQPPAEPMFARNSNDGVVLCIPFGDSWYRVIAWDLQRERAPLSEPVTAAEMRDAFLRIAGTDFGMTEPRWSSRFLSERRQARRYQVGRVFLAGDAAHVHSPLGGQGMNTGIGDAMNLGWKLAGAVHGWAPPGLLASYEGERHPVGAWVLTMTDAFNRMMVGHSWLHRTSTRLAITTVLRLHKARMAIGGRLTGLGIAYPRQRGQHKWTGRRMPDVRCGEHRLYELLRDGRFVVLSRPGAPGVDVVGARWSDRVRVASCKPDAVPDLPQAVLVRPDGYVAWASDTVSPGDVTAAVTSWCGPATFAAQ